MPKGGKMDNIVITALVDKQTYLPIRISADIAPLLQYIIDEADLKYFPEIRVDSVPVEVNVTATDTIESITLPDSRRNAVVITPEQTQEPEQTQTPEQMQEPAGTAAPEESAAAEPAA